MSGLLPYQGIATFLKSPQEAERPFAFMGLPYDAATTFRSGARMGPGAIRQASMMLTDGHHPIFGVDPCALVNDYGDAPINQVGQENAIQAVDDAVSGLLSRALHPVLAGGDHLVTLGVLRAMHRHHGVPLAVIHFDAHCDTWPDHFGDRIGHGTWVRNAVEEGLVDPTRFVQIGIRSPCDPVTSRWLASKGGIVVTPREAKGNFDHDWIEAWASSRIGPTYPTYVTFDIDALDPAYAPGTGTPEVGGLSSMDGLMMLESLKGLNLVGMDVVEVCPAYDPAGITALAAATMLWTYLAMMGSSQPQ